MQNNLNQVAEIALGALKKNGAGKAQVSVASTEAHEVNVEGGKFSLLRTTFDQSIAMRAIVDQRQASMSSNQFSDKLLFDTAKQTVDSARAGAVDEAYDIAPMQPAQKFNFGPAAGDIDNMTDAAAELVRDLKARFPKIIMEQLILKFSRTDRNVANTNGVSFQIAQNGYDVTCIFSGKSAGKTSGMNYTEVGFLDFKKPLMQIGGIEGLLRDSEQLIESKAFEGKFVGDLIVTPHCLPSILRALFSSLSMSALMTGESVYRDKLGSRIAVEGFNLRLKPQSPELVIPKFVTADGFASQNVNVVENGILKSFLLDQYGSAKLKQPRTGADTDRFVVDPGQTPLAEIISKTKRGLLLGGFAGGTPSSNGDLTGVAKNSFYIEDGQIKKPITECMISGNVPRMLTEIAAISHESIHFGSMLLPWVKIAGATISGK